MNAPSEATRLPFDLQFQMGLLRLMCEDGHFGSIIGKHLKAEYFEDEALAWAWLSAQSHEQRYGQYPALATLRQYAQQADPRVAALYAAMVQRVEQTPLIDEQWMRDAAVSFCKRNLFVAAVQESSRDYNKGNLAEAYERLARASEELEKATWTTPDATLFFDDLYRRQIKRITGESEGATVATGIHELDKLLGGGLSKGELGCWISVAKGGKSTMLVTMGVSATSVQMMRVAHFIFEGGRTQVENRYESSFTGEAYQEIKHGLSSDAYVRAAEQYKYLRGKLYLHAMVDSWDHTIVDVSEAMRSLKRVHGWDPDVVIIDYGDLLSGRDKNYRSETQKQKAVFRDLKLFAARGYAVWTASQVQRPGEGSEETADWIYSRQIADCYEKVRVCDFLGSLNQCRQEKDEKVMRVFAEIYRDNAAGLRFCLYCDFSRMLIESRPGIRSSVMPDLYASSSRIGGKTDIQKPTGAVQTAHQINAWGMHGPS